MTTHTEAVQRRAAAQRAANERREAMIDLDLDAARGWNTASRTLADPIHSVAEVAGTATSADEATRIAGALAKLVATDKTVAGQNDCFYLAADARRADAVAAVGRAVERWAISGRDARIDDAKKWAKAALRATKAAHAVGNRIAEGRALADIARPWAEAQAAVSGAAAAAAEHSRSESGDKSARAVSRAEDAAKWAAIAARWARVATASAGFVTKPWLPGEPGERAPFETNGSDAAGA